MILQLVLQCACGAAPVASVCVCNREMCSFSLFLFCWFIYEFGDLLLWSEAWRRSGRGGKRGQNAAYRPVRAHCSPPWEDYHNNNNLNTQRKCDFKLPLLPHSAGDESMSYLLHLSGVKTVEIFLNVPQFHYVSIFQNRDVSHYKN